ncbi:NAD-dependent deacylase [Priestia abyssalis]|uniref:NAD-dependent deacylase n=1 Tax=Priestia abyssalis TaxID=1221450 RepID=UPI000995885D|nr:NAD-dependent deacylase [Priestia abyssalis]
MHNHAKRETIIQLVQFMKESSHTVILTGAGMSTESGVPDFRSKSGWWKNIDPRSVATVEALEENYDLFHEFYSMRIHALAKCLPHKGHHLLANWQKQGLIHTIATQNVDNFHQMAGASNVQTLHGSIRSFRCHHCGAPSKENTFLLKEPCTNCGGNIRPEVVLFGEPLPEKTWQNVLQHIHKADLVIVIGTSLEVYPVNQLPEMTNGHTVLLNLEEVEGKYEFDLMIKGKAKDVLERVDELLKIV